MRVAPQNQRDHLLTFAGVLDAKLADVAYALAILEHLVREACLLNHLPITSPAYWQGWNRLRTQLGSKFHALVAAVNRVMADTPRSSALVENLNSRLRTYFTLRRHLGGSYLLEAADHIHLSRMPARFGTTKARRMIDMFTDQCNHYAGYPFSGEFTMRPSHCHPEPTHDRSVQRHATRGQFREPGRRRLVYRDY